MRPLSTWPCLSLKKTGFPASPIVSFYRTTHSSFACAAKSSDLLSSPLLSCDWHCRAIVTELMLLVLVCPQEPSAVFSRDAAGASISHLALLLGHTSLFVHLCRAYPALVAAEYTGELYKGETSLHIAIVRKDYTAIEFLMGSSTFVTALLRARAVGSFFRFKSVQNINDVGERLSEPIVRPLWCEPSVVPSSYHVYLLASGYVTWNRVACICYARTTHIDLALVFIALWIIPFNCNLRCS